MQKHILLIQLFLLALISNGQDSTSVNLGVENNKGWTNGITSGRLEVGLQKSYYYGLGLSRVAYSFDGSGIAAVGYYAMGEFTPTDNIFGIKIGTEINTMGLGIGIDLKYLKNHSDKDFTVTPKIGIGGAGFIILFYGFNISTNNYPFQPIGRHQISLVFNINKSILTGKNYSYKNAYR
jgi:hypothetical protein